MPYCFFSMAFRLQGIQTGFETAESFHHRHSSIQINDKESRPSAGMPLDVSDGQVSVSNSEQHCLIVGSTGTGKTRRIVYPSIILHARAGNSLLIIDPKGEAYRNCSRELRKIGHEVLVVNLRCRRRLPDALQVHRQALGQEENRASG